MSIFARHPGESRNDELRKRVAQAAERNAAIRSSIGGWLMNSRLTPLAPEIPNAWNAFGNSASARLPDNVCSAEIIPLRPPSLAPPASARNSRQRENHATTIVARTPSTV